MIDLDRLAEYLQAEIESRGVSLRKAADDIGCSPATLARLLQGEKALNVPDSGTLDKAAMWLGKRLSDFEEARPTGRTASIADVEVHLRALPGLSKADAEGLVAMVKAAYAVAAKRKPDKKKS